MMRADIQKRQGGFTLIEMLTALGIFLVITGAAFTLLSSSQQRYRTESQVLTSFQEARLGLDQMVRDINDSGFPPPTFANTDPRLVTNTPFAWSPGYPNNPCQIGTAGGGTCVTSNDYAPGDFDIIIETNPDPNRDAGCAPSCPVQWIRYQLDPNGTTLMRGVADKVPGGNPDFAFSGANALVPFVQNVVNNSPNLQIGQFQLIAAYPAVFPGGNPVPIFQYVCDEPSLSPSPPYPTVPCAIAAGDNSPKNIRDVLITLIVAAPLPDATTGKPRLVQLEGRGRRVNPNQ
jgi:prepilin-type N-terminal cleavage/methylation domain-containing protein